MNSFSEFLSNTDAPTIAMPPRGIAPEILITHVHNTAPFVFEKAWPSEASTSYLTRLAETARIESGHESFSHDEYFSLCLSAHYASVATFVPTDVDNQIRFRLWHPALDVGTILKMAETVRQSRTWDWLPVSTRWVRSPRSGELLGGHGGEWFSVAAGAYGALRHKSAGDAAEVGTWILEEVQRQFRVSADLHAAKDGIGLCKASVLLAHNIGDLNRVFEMWEMEKEDPLVQQATAVCEKSELFRSASNLNRDHIANENHRHFALRKPKALRSSSQFLLGLGPFFDAWGETIGSSDRLSDEDRAEVIEALIHGFQKLKTPAVGYARALSGIERSIAGGLRAAGALVPAKVQRSWTSGTLRQLCSVDRDRFESQWNHLGNRYFPR